MTQIYWYEGIVLVAMLVGLYYVEKWKKRKMKIELDEARSEYILSLRTGEFPGFVILLMIDGNHKDIDVSELRDIYRQRYLPYKNGDRMPAAHDGGMEHDLNGFIICVGHPISIEFKRQMPVLKGLVQGWFDFLDEVYASKVSGVAAINYGIIDYHPPESPEAHVGTLKGRAKTEIVQSLKKSGSIQQFQNGISTHKIIITEDAAQILLKKNPIITLIMPDPFLADIYAGDFDPGTFKDEEQDSSA